MHHAKIGFCACLCVLVFAACGLEASQIGTDSLPIAGTSESAVTQPPFKSAEVVFKADALDIGIDNPFGRAISFEELDSAFGPPDSAEIHEAQANDFAMWRDYGHVAVNIYLGSRSSTSGGIVKMQFTQGGIRLSPDYSVSIGESLDEILYGLKNEGNSISTDDYYGQVQVLYGTIVHMSTCGYVVYQGDTPAKIMLADQGLLLEIALDSLQKASNITLISET